MKKIKKIAALFLTAVMTFGCVSGINLENSYAATNVTGVLSGTADSNTSLNITGTVGSPMEEKLYINFVRATNAKLFTDGQDLSNWCTNLPAGMQLQKNGPANSGSGSTFYLKLVGRPTDTFNGSLNIIVPKDYLRALDDYVIPEGPFIVNTNSSSIVIKNPKAAPTGLVGYNSTIDKSTGVIVGVDETMEYYINEQWVPITGNSISNLSAGVYDVRYAETESEHASASVKITIGESNYVIFGNDNIVGTSGVTNLMNAKYDNNTGKLSWDCDATGSLMYYPSYGTNQSESYTNFNRFYATAYLSNATVSKNVDTHSEGFAVTNGDLNIGSSSYNKVYCSSSTTNPYINIKSFLEAGESSSKEYLWLQIFPCNPGNTLNVNTYFWIRIEKKSLEEDLRNAQSDAKTAIESDVKLKTDAINALKNLSQNEKDKFITQLTKDADTAKTAINQAKKINQITEAKTTYETLANKILADAKTKDSLNKAKTDAKKSIEDDVTTKTNAIKALANLTDTEKTNFIKQVTDAATTAKTAIDNATTVAQVASAKDAYDTSAKNVLDGATLQNAKNKANEDIVLNAEKQKAVINAMENLSDKEKENFIKQVTDAATTAKTAIDNAKTVAQVASAKDAYDTSAKNVLDGATLRNAKNKANADIDEYATTKKAEIEKMTDLTADQKKAFENAIDVEVEKAKDNVDKATTTDNVTTAVNGFETEADKVVTAATLQAAKNKAKADIDAYATTKKAEIDAMENLSDEEKDNFKALINKEAATAKIGVNDAKTLTEVTEEYNAFVEDADNIVKAADFQDAKNLAKATLNAYAEGRKEKIEALDLSDEQKQTLFDELDEFVETTNNLIGNASTEEIINESLTNGKADVDTTYDKSVAEEFTNKYLRKENGGDIYKEVNTENIDQIISGEDAWKELTDKQKDVVNSMIANSTDFEKYEDYLASAKIFANKSAKDFIQNHLTDKDDNVIIEVRKDTIDNILGGEEDWNNLSKAEQAEINSQLSKAGATQTYEEMLAAAKAMLDETTDGFIKDHMTKVNGDTIIDVTKDTLDKILGGEEDFNALTPAQQAEVNAKLKAAGATMTYQEMLEKAKDMLEETSHKFIRDHMTKTDGSIITKVSKDTYENILGGAEDFNALTPAQQAEVNAKLKAAGATQTYQEMLAQVQKELEETGISFIQKYVSDKNGNIYKKATKDNYAQILSGLEEWNNLTQIEKDVINAALVLAGGQTYEELIKQADKIKASMTDTSDMTNMYGYTLGLSVCGLAVLYELKKRRQVQK